MSLELGSCLYERAVRNFVSSIPMTTDLNLKVVKCFVRLQYVFVSVTAFAWNFFFGRWVVAVGKEVAVSRELRLDFVVCNGVLEACENDASGK